VASDENTTTGTRNDGSMTKKEEPVLHTTEEPDTETEESPFFLLLQGECG